jgi:hypothetical protein
MGFEFTGSFLLNKLCQKKNGEFFLKKLEKLVEFILEQEKISQNFQIFWPHTPNQKKKKKKKGSEKYHCYQTIQPL